MSEWGSALYLMQAGGTGALKVGRSNNPYKRRAQLQTGCPHSIKILAIFEGEGNKEKGILSIMKRHKTKSYSGEWFYESGWGDLPDWIINEIPPEKLELVNSNWWKDEITNRNPGPG